MIIHISGASGSGKTTLGNKLQEALGDRVLVVDVDRILDSFIAKHIIVTSTEQFGESYQKFIDEFVKDAKSKHNHIVFVGLNAFVVGEKHFYEDADHNEHSFKLPKRYFDLGSDYNFYIDLDADTIVKQMFDRGYVKHIDWFSDWMKRRKDIVYSELIKDENIARKDICAALNELFDFEDIRSNIEKWDAYYKAKGYTFYPREQIYDKVIELINQNTQDVQAVQEGGYSTYAKYAKYTKYKTKYLALKRGQECL